MTDQKNYLTDAGYKKLKDELGHLKKVRRPQIAERIKQAKDYGDLSENAEYADAREEQSFVEGRILELESVLKNATVVKSNESNPDIVQIGDEVVVERDGTTFTYLIVGSNETDPSEGKISNESPIGRAIIGKKAGEEVLVSTPKGPLNWRIVSIKAL